MKTNRTGAPVFRRAWLWTGCLAFATMAFEPQPARAAVTKAWEQRYGSETGSQDSAYNVVTDAAGNVIVADIPLLIKYSGAGVPLWTNRHNGPVYIEGEAYFYIQGGAYSKSSAMLIGTNGSAQFQDTNSPNSAGFYRARLQ